MARTPLLRKAACAAIALLNGVAMAAPAGPVPIDWLGGSAPAQPTGISFGVPFPRGAAVSASSAFTLTGPEGKALPTQTWPLAYWPDGSLKWVGVAAVPEAGSQGEFHLEVGQGGQAPEGAAPIVVHESDTTYLVDAGQLQVLVPMHGNKIIQSITLGGREVARNGRLICIDQDSPDGDFADAPHRTQYGTHVDKVTLEQKGPVRAVVKIEGRHVADDGGRAWLPFVVRLYIYAGAPSIRMTHSIVFDGDQDKDFIRGLGVVFDVPFREEVQNRHVFFSGQDKGLWGEPVQPMIGRGGRYVHVGDTRKDYYPTQIAGQRVPNRADIDPRGRGLLSDWAVWDDFKLSQPNSDGFTIVKRTNPASTWIKAGAGQQSNGLVFVGDVTGGLAVSQKDFWQSYPSGMEVRHASSGDAQLVMWLWSPDAPAMDMRHYDVRGHGLEAVYEDVHPGFSTAHGIGRTTELTLFPTDAVPARDTLAQMAAAGAEPPLLVCTPQYLHDADAFGHWGLEDHSTPLKDDVEKRLAETLNFYIKQPAQQHWYGFWDFGDVMHSYDPQRHEWRYDLGGMAWDNSELGTDLWLWYSFLRTGRADVFRMAEAMIRHTGEVDTYHIGRFAGLGSRHNVVHWGGGAKEARISQAPYSRIYYYLTTDERVGDLMHAEVNADYKMLDYDPMRFAQPLTEAEKKIAPTRVRLGPDWFAFVGNWMTEWERTGDTRWRDKILAGVHSLAQMPYGMRTGKNLVFGYDPATGKLYQLDDTPGVYNLATIMGGAEVAMELSGMLDDPEWHKLWNDYCRLYQAPKDVLVKDRQTGKEGLDGAYTRDGRLAAWLYAATGNKGYLDRAVTFIQDRPPYPGAPERKLHKVNPPDVLNPVDEGLGNTNGAAQRGLELIALLGYAGKDLPANLPPPGPPPQRLQPNQ